MLTFEYYNLRTMDRSPAGGALGVEVRNVDTSRPLEEPRRMLKRTQMFGDKTYLEV